MLDQPVGFPAPNDLPGRDLAVCHVNHDIDDLAFMDHSADNSSSPPCSGYDSLSSTEQTYLESFTDNSATDPTLPPISPLDIPISPSVRIDYCTTGLT